jgi:hypothetical protein
MKRLPVASLSLGLTAALLAQGLLADTRTWKGTAGTSWSAPANWAEAVAPSNGDNLVFTSGVPASQLQSSGDGALPSLRVNGNNSGGLLHDGVSWAAFAADRSAGSGANAWQFTGTGSPGLAARGAALVVSAASTTATTFDRNFTLGCRLSGPNGLQYANAPVVLNRGAGVDTITLSAASDRTISLEGITTFANGAYTVAGVVQVSDAGGLRSGTYDLFTCTGTLTDAGLAVGSLPRGVTAALAFDTASTPRKVQLHVNVASGTVI